MEQYVSKSALVAEIEKLKSEALQKKEQCKSKGLSKIVYQIGTYNKILSILNTLEVEEVDLEKEIKDYIQALPHARTGVPNGWRLSWHEDKVMEIAKHFFELGLKAKGE